jgi:hypothetical protein
MPIHVHNVRKRFSANKGEGIITIGARGEILRRAEVGQSFFTIAWTSITVTLNVYYVYAEIQS